MLNHQGAHQRKPQPGSFPGMDGIIDGLLERPADARQKVFLHADAVIPDRQH